MSKSSQALARSSEDSIKRWLAVLIAFVTLLVGLVSFLQADASGRNAQLTRRSQQDAIDSTSIRARGQQDSAYAYYVVAQEYDALRAQADRYITDKHPDLASAFITASEQITSLSPMLAPPYVQSLPDDTGWQGLYQYQADTWVVTSTLLSQQRELLGDEANAWSGKSNNYVASIAVFAVALFLFGLAATLGGFVRWLFVGLGIALTGATLLGVMYTVVVPVHHIKDQAVDRYAQGAGLYWQGKYADAIQAFDASITSDPEYANAYSQRGEAYLRLRPPKLAEAIRDFNTALLKGNDRYDVYWDLGWAYYLSGDYPRSIGYSQNALDSNSKVCGPAFNVAVARLASGDLPQAERSYEQAISRCEQIMKDSSDVVPASLWIDMQGSVDDIENLLCQTHHLYCYDGRDQPNVSNVQNPDALRQLAEKVRVRLKEALTSLEYQQTATVTLTGATAEPLRFGNQIIDENGQVRSYAVRSIFPNDGQYVYALWNYTGMKAGSKTVRKVYRDGVEETGLRFVYDWQLDENGATQWGIYGRLTQSPGNYTVEIYVNGQLLTQGSFTIAGDAVLPPPELADVAPSVPAGTGNLLLGDDFADNTHGWWTGSIDRTRDAQIADGEYTVRLSTAGDFWRPMCIDCGLFDNFDYEATARYIDGPTDRGYGLVARADRAANNFYYFLVDADGAAAIGKIVAGKLSILNPWTQNAAINTKGSNRLAILARGNRLQFYVNGQPLPVNGGTSTTFLDSSLSTGYVGAAVEFDGLGVAFSQVRVWQAR